MRTEPLVVVREELQPKFGGDWIATKQEPGAAPLFNTREASLVFFGRSWNWLEQLLVNPEFRHEIDALKIPTLKNKGRRIQLRHAEEISHILFKHGKLESNRFLNSLRIIRAIADNFGLLIGD